MTRLDHLYMPEGHMDELYNSKNPLVRYVHNDRLNSISKEIPKKNGLKILDAGCGEGHLLAKMHDENNKNFYYGVDVTDIALQKAKDRCPYAIFEKKDLSNLSDSYNNFFDIVICTEVLEHIFEYKKVIKEFRKVLKEDGLLIITFPNEILWMASRFILRRKTAKVPDHVTSFNPYKMSMLTGMKLIHHVNLPFQIFPFLISLGCLMVFKKINSYLSG